MEWVMILGFAISSSLDNLGVGISYGIQNINIGILSNLIIAIICFSFSMFGIVFGKWVSTFFPGILPVLLGAFILFVIGIRIVLLAKPRKRTDSEIGENSHNIGKVNLQKPESFDANKNKNIELGEAMLLGIALSANALTNGLSAGLFGFSPLAISVMASIGSFVSVWSGVTLGRKVVNIRIGSFTIGQFSTMLSGVIILLIGLKNIFPL
ncbi:MAG: sporulation membrane protein YtaF [Desulfitobacterium hafniense]|nr:sporulation membrane protein YtaF [Desulfitobacterium hafniense]